MRKMAKGHKKGVYLDLIIRGKRNDCMMNLQSQDIDFLETMGGGLWEAYKVCGVVASVTCLLYGILQSLWKVFV